jgi:hypothetical protein
MRWLRSIARRDPIADAHRRHRAIIVAPCTIRRARNAMILIRCSAPLALMPGFAAGPAPAAEPTPADATRHAQSTMRNASPRCSPR